MEGWVMLHRKLLDSPVFKNNKTLPVFLYCMLKASHKDHEVLVGDTPIHLKAGQLVSGRNKISERTGLSVQNVRTALKVLKKMEILTIRILPKCSIISITNWEAYQQTNQQVTSNQPASNQQVTTNKNGKNGKNGKNLHTHTHNNNNNITGAVDNFTDDDFIPKTIPKDFYLNDNLFKLATERLNDRVSGQCTLDISNVFEQFRLHYLTSGKKSCNWEASWISWVTDERTIEREVRNMSWGG